VHNYILCLDAQSHVEAFLMEWSTITLKTKHFV
jgi:hypothetical protein